MTKTFQLNWLAAAIGTLLLTGCGDAETTIVEQDPIEVPGDDHDDDHNHDDGLIDSLGRLAVTSAESNEAVIYDLDDNSLLDTFPLTHESSAVSSSAGYRYAVFTTRTQDHVGFIDGGLWREDHVDHLHDYEQAPVMSDYALSGSRPTHVVTHDGKMAVFYDGDAEAGTTASVQVVNDTDISSETADLPTLPYNINMHGVAEPRGEHLLATIRRDDALNTSANKVLPDQIGVFHWHDGEYEQEQVLEVDCPDLHGAAQNVDYNAFGCSDGIMVAHQHDTEYHAVKIPNVESLGGLRVGSIFAHEDSDSFFGVASQHSGGAAILVNINPVENDMEMVDWEPATDAQAISYSYSADGDHFLILDNQGFLTVLTPHDHDGHSHWEFDKRINISEEDVATMPEGQSFSMAISYSSNIVYVADPIAQHVLAIDLESSETVSDIPLDFAPAGIAWMGIPETEHAH
ncbi:5-methyltetrahydrofolate--homocysteine methyltransferase [Alteromonas pelagimontana]|uniref:5-methyltetrahydrofolate--homocysteine methyltransferase n=1 Tax=Alteromonas pelagimontana TaxID=1858656 RepID=A0A6M4MD78_9ALTE|nr:5-methyltetrahydrofolate--homocysteine methyltransferase [Alteromonas pelagimontana]QJR81083.1 5-methyltetrahydrofolate--homocysteine methyltransferase [Alteromonas pelagimontana]